MQGSEFKLKNFQFLYLKGVKFLRLKYLKKKVNLLKLLFSIFIYSFFFKKNCTK